MKIMVILFIAFFGLSGLSMGADEMIPMTKKEADKINKMLIEDSPSEDFVIDMEVEVKSGGHSACKNPYQSQSHIDCGFGCQHPGDVFMGFSSGEHPSCLVKKPKNFCDPPDAWTGWVTVGGSVGNPCPSNCKRGDEIGLSGPRSVDLYKIQFKHKFECLVP